MKEQGDTGGLVFKQGWEKTGKKKGQDNQMKEECRRIMETHQFF